MKYMWTKWRGNPPPHELKVIGSWDDPPEKDGALHQAGTACKRGGCCFFADFGETLIPPVWWRADQPGESR